MRKAIRFVKKYWYGVLLIPVAILAWRYMPRAFAKTSSTPNVSRPPIDGSKPPADDWGALAPADVPEGETITPWDNIEPFGGYGDVMDGPIAPANPYTVDVIKPDTTWGDVPFAGSNGGYY